MSVRPRHSRRLRWSLDAYLRPDMSEQEARRRLEALLPEELLPIHVAGWAMVAGARPDHFVTNFPVDEVSHAANPAYLWLNVFGEPDSMAGTELEETCVRAIDTVGLRLLLPVRVTGFPEPRLGPKSKRRRDKWRKAYNDGPHHVSHYRRLGKQQDRRRIRHAIDQALRTGRYSEPTSQGPLPKQLFVPPRGLEDIGSSPE